MSASAASALRPPISRMRVPEAFVTTIGVPTGWQPWLAKPSSWMSPKIESPTAPACAVRLSQASTLSPGRLAPLATPPWIRAPAGPAAASSAAQTCVAFTENGSVSMIMPRWGSGPAAPVTDPGSATRSEMKPADQTAGGPSSRSNRNGSMTVPGRDTASAHRPAVCSVSLSSRIVLATVVPRTCAGWSSARSISIASENIAR
jgi:hypothetical protein